jgi:hypothetical protein
VLVPDGGALDTGSHPVAELLNPELLTKKFDPILERSESGWRGFKNRLFKIPLCFQSPNPR